MNFPALKFETKSKDIHINTLKNNDKAAQKLCKTIEVSKIISIFVPHTATIEPFNYPCYTIENFKIADIFTKNFINGYVLNGTLCCASNNNHENLQMLLYERILTIRMDRELYYSLAAIHLAKYLSKSQDDKLFATFKVDLSNTEDVYKIRNELLSEEINKISIHFDWKPHEQDVCRSSLAKFLNDMGYTVKENEIKSIDNILYSIKIPILPSRAELNDETHDDWRNIVENISLHMLGCNVDEINEQQEGLLRIKRANVLHYKGFLSSSIFNDLFDNVQNILKENSSLPYIAISTVPFSVLQKHFNSKLYFITPESIYYASE